MNHGVGENRSRIHIKIDGLARLVIQNVFSGVLPVYIVTEYQKSGGSWVGQMLSDYMEIPFPRNRIPTIRKSVLHAHILPTPFLKNVLCVYRDGRDAVVSSYYHMLFESDKNSPYLVKKCREELRFDDYDDVRSNMPRFIEYLFETHHKRTLTRWNQFTWDKFVDEWYGKNVVSVKYEDLVISTQKEMSRVLLELTEGKIDEDRLGKIVEKYSFKKQAKREPGKENSRSFLRKGVPGDWKNKFTKEAAIMFNQYAGEQLIKLGYEKDIKWIYQV